MITRPKVEGGRAVVYGREGVLTTTNRASGKAGKRQLNSNSLRWYRRGGEDGETQ